jgi:hypothetical protein
MPKVGESIGWGLGDVLAKRSRVSAGGRATPRIQREAWDSFLCLDFACPVWGEDSVSIAVRTRDESSMGSINPR